MVPLFERYGDQLVEYWKNALDANRSAVLSVSTDLTRTVCITLVHLQYFTDGSLYYLLCLNLVHEHFTVVSNWSRFLELIVSLHCNLSIYCMHAQFSSV